MQNQNAQTWSWPQGAGAGTAASASSSFPQASSSFPAQFPPPNVDPSTLMATYQQMYGASAAAATQSGTDYDPTQWSAAQMQQWQQWQQWQEKFQEWQTQYGKKYAETMAAMGQSPNITMPGAPPAMNLLQKNSAPVPNPGYTTANPPLPPTNQPVPPPPPEEEKPPPPKAPSSKEKGKPTIEPKDNPEELSEAEKTFDEQFKQWEGQFNAWKKQNQDHPDKTQYREYEKKWEQWREQLLQRREQMRKKRLSKTSAPNDLSRTPTPTSTPTPTAAATPTPVATVTAPPKLEDAQNKLSADQGTAQSKPLDPDYSYSTQGSQLSPQMASYTTAPHKFDMSRPPPFGNQQGNQGSFNQGNADGPRNQDNFFNQRPPLLGQDGPKNLDFNRPPGNFGNWGKDNIDFNRLGPFNKFQDDQNFNRDPGFFENQSPNFEGNQERNFNQGPNDGNFNKKFRGQNFDSRNFGSDLGQGRFGGPNFSRNNDFPSNRFGNDNFDDNSDDFNRGPPKFGGNNRDFGNNDTGPNFGRSPFNNAGPRNKFDPQGPNPRFNDQNFNQCLSNDRNYNSEMKSLFDASINAPGGGSSLLGNSPGSASLLGNPLGPPSLLSNPTNSLIGTSPSKSLLGNAPKSLLGNAPSNSLLGNAPSKSKVPSLFDITFDKPPALMPDNAEKKPWEKYEKDDYYDDPFQDKQEEEEDVEEEEETGPWANKSNNNFNSKFNSPWTKPWDVDRANADKNTGPRSNPWQKGPKSGQWEEGPRQGPWEQQGKRPDQWQDNQDSGRGPFGNSGPWMNDNNSSKDLEKAELSGYVGNILAKLGNINADNMPPNFTGRNEDSAQDNSRRPNFPNRGGDNDGNRFRNDIRGNNFGRGGNNRNQGNFNKRFFNENDNSQNTPSPRENFQDTNSPRDNFRQNEQNRNFRNQNRFGPKQGLGNMDQLDESSRSSIGPVNVGGPPNRNSGTDFTDDVNLTDENFHTQNQEKFLQDRLEENELFNTGGDIDDRNQFENESSNVDRDDGNSQGRNDGNSMGRDNREPFLREDSRGSFGKEEQGNFGHNELSGDKKFGRDNRNFRGRGRGRRGGFDRDDRDDRGVRGYDRDDRRGPEPYDRYARGREYPPEPEWNPQVFDYSSQTRSHRYLDPEDIFKFSTVVDYSHGQPENKQTFDYGHGGKGTDKTEEKAFDLKFGAAAPEVIDYGHGSVNKEPNALPDWKKEKEKEKEVEIEIISEIKSEPKIVEPIRERSRSPPPPPFRRSSRSPPFRGRRSRSRDRFGRPILKRNNRKEEAPEMKFQTGDKENSKNSFDVTTVLVEDIICAPGRSTRPNKLVFIMRGLPGSGKTYVTKLIKDKEIEMGGDAPRILSLDDYFMTEVEKEVTDSETGRKVKNKVLEYEYESAVEPHYRGSLLKAFKKTISDGFFSFVIIDSVNEKTKDYEEMWSFAKQKGFQVYVAEMDDDVTVCTKRNVHKRTEKEIQDLASVWEKTPSHYIRLDVRSLLQAAAITEVEMEVVSDTEMEKVDDEDEGKEDKKEDEEEDDQGVATFVKSRWDNVENSEQKLDRLDGLKRRREGCHTTMEDYLQLPDDFDQQSGPSTGKKRVRWADLEERRQQEKMRAIGFVVGQTDWQRMTDPTFGESALTRTKYI